MSDPIRISPREARQKVVSGQALLVCAYDDDDKFKKIISRGHNHFLNCGHNYPDLLKVRRSFFTVPERRRPVLPVRRQN